MTATELEDHLLAWLDGTSGRTTFDIVKAFPRDLEPLVLASIVKLGGEKRIFRVGANLKGETVWRVDR